MDIYHGDFGEHDRGDHDRSNDNDIVADREVETDFGVRKSGPPVDDVRVDGGFFPVLERSCDGGWLTRTLTFCF